MLWRVTLFTRRFCFDMPERSLDIHAKTTRGSAVQLGFSGANRAQKAEI
jgi:hypothetical protein